jgi:DegV family protein with EDD domain
MGEKFAIVTDSTADIPLQDQNALNIVVVPAVVTIDGESYKDGMEISRTEFYQRLPVLSSPPTTGAPSMQTFEDTYEEVLQSGIDKILSIHLPPSLSGMLSVATQAARSFGERVSLFDSGQVSLGMGFQVIEAASTIIHGGTFEAVLTAAQHARNNVRLIALIDTLEFLKRSGRVSWLTAGLGNLLRVKIILELINGVVNRLGQVRTRRKAIEQLKAIAESWGRLDRLAIPHSASPEEAAVFAEELKGLCSRPPVIIEVTTAIGAHIGPGALGVIGLIHST